MSVGTADVWKAFNAAWDASGLDAIFKSLWPNPADATQVVLNDIEAMPGRVWPYCVVNGLSPRTKVRMSGGLDSIREVRDSMFTLNVHAKEIAGDSRSAKEVAAYLTEEVMKVFGGHPTITPTADMTLDNGNVLSVSYQTDYGTWVNYGEYAWVISYTMLVDVPVMSS